MKLSVLLGILFFAVLGLTNTATANFQCAEIYQKTQTNGLEFLMANELMRELDVRSQELSQTTIRSEANQQIHSLVVLANRILDTAVDYIIAMNFQKMPPEVQAQKASMTEQLIEKLQIRLEIGNNAMQEAIQNRVQNDVAELKAQYEARQQRRAIGFGRDQSSESFHSDSVARQPIGFRARERETENDSDAVEKIPMGFEIQNPKNLEKTIRELVEFEEVVEPGPIGFVPPKQNTTDAPARPQPIGFIRPRPESERITEENLHKIIFDLDRGVFEFERSAS